MTAPRGRGRCGRERQQHQRFRKSGDAPRVVGLENLQAMDGHRTHVLIAVEPPLFGSALAAVLRGWPLDVTLWAGGPPGGPCDIALVTGSPPDGVEAAVLVSLPDLESGGSTALVSSGGEWMSVEIHQLDDVLGMVRDLSAA